MNTHTLLLFNALVSSILLFSLTAKSGYLTVGESGEILPEGQKYQIGLAPQLILNNDTGANVAAFLDAAWNDSMSSRFILGVGVVDFYTSGSFKYIPFPDYENQPAIGLKGSLWYAREGSENITTFHIAPLVSKKVQTHDYGLFTPYGAVGLSFYQLGGKNKTGTQFFVGTDWKTSDFPDLNFTGEWALSLEKSTSSLTVFVAMPFDDKKGFKK